MVDYTQTKRPIHAPTTPTEARMESPTENRPPKRSGLGPDVPEREPERPAISKESAMKTTMRIVVAAALLISGRLLQAGTLTVLYSFGSEGGGDGQNPTAALIQGSDGVFYGTTANATHNGAAPQGASSRSTPRDRLRSCTPS